MVGPLLAPYAVRNGSRPSTLLSGKSVRLLRIGTIAPNDVGLCEQTATPREGVERGTSPGGARAQTPCGSTRPIPSQSVWESPPGGDTGSGHRAGPPEGRPQTAPQMPTAPGERRIVGGGEVEAHHPEQGVQEPFGLAQREMVEEPQGQGGLDGEIRVAPLPTPPAAPAGRPGSDRFRGQPHRHIAALLHESSRARTMPIDKILTGRCDTTLVGQGRSSD